MCEKKSIPKINTFLVNLGPDIITAGLLEYFLPSPLATGTRLQLWANFPGGSNKAQTSWQKRVFPPAAEEARLAACGPGRHGALLPCPCPATNKKVIMHLVPWSFTEQPCGGTPPSVPDPASSLPPLGPLSPKHNNPQAQGSGSYLSEELGDPGGRPASVRISLSPGPGEEMNFFLWASRHPAPSSPRGEGGKFFFLPESVCDPPSSST